MKWATRKNRRGVTGFAAVRVYPRWPNQHVRTLFAYKRSFVALRPGFSAGLPFSRQFKGSKYRDSVNFADGREPTQINCPRGKFLAYQRILELSEISLPDQGHLKHMRELKACASPLPKDAGEAHAPLFEISVLLNSLTSQRAGTRGTTQPPP